MERFNLDEYIKNPSKRVVTRDGRNVEILCTDYIGFGPIIAKVEGNSFSQMFYSDGRSCRCEESTYDLFFAPEEHEGWINFFGDSLCELYIGDLRIFESKENAEKNGKNNRNYVKSVKIKWEE